MAKNSCGNQQNPFCEYLEKRPNYEDPEKKEQTPDTAAGLNQQCQTDIEKQLNDIRIRLRLDELDKNQNTDSYQKLQKDYDTIKENYEKEKSNLTESYCEKISSQLNQLIKNFAAPKTNELERQYEEMQDTARQYLIPLNLRLNQEYPTQRNRQDTRIGNLNGGCIINYRKKDGTLDFEAQERGDALPALPQYNQDGSPKEFKLSPPPGSGGRTSILVFRENIPGKKESGGDWYFKDELFKGAPKEAHPLHGWIIEEIPKDQKEKVAEETQTTPEQTEHEAEDMLLIQKETEKLVQEKLLIKENEQTISEISAQIVAEIIAQKEKPSTLAKKEAELATQTIPETAETKEQSALLSLFARNHQELKELVEKEFEEIPQIETSKTISEIIHTEPEIYQTFEPEKALPQIFAELKEVPETEEQIEKDRREQINLSAINELFTIVKQYLSQKMPEMKQIAANALNALLQISEQTIKATITQKELLAEKIPAAETETSQISAAELLKPQKEEEPAEDMVYVFVNLHQTLSQMKKLHFED